VWKSPRAHRNATLHLEVTLCVWKSPSQCENHTRRVEITLVQVKITLVRVEDMLVSAEIFFLWGFHILRAEIILVFRSNSYVWKSYSSCINNTQACLNHTLHVKITLCVWKSHSTRRNHSFDVMVRVSHNNFYSTGRLLVQTLIGAYFSSSAANS
jgi:hypothetical protein